VAAVKLITLIVCFGVSAIKSHSIQIKISFHLLVPL